MEIKSTIVSSAIATSVMTLFSSFISTAERKEFVEPKLLAKVLEDLHQNLSKSEAQVLAWEIHYAIGLIFSSVYAYLWKNTSIKPTFLSGSLFGAVSGLIGIGGWMTILKLTPHNPVVDRKNYYEQLLLAHIIFGIGSTVGYRLSNKNH